MRRLVICCVVACATAVAALEDPPPLARVAAHVRTDDEIESAIVKALVANPEVFASDVQAESAGRVVILSGTVRDETAKATAGKIARAVPGVRAVKNRLGIARRKR